MARSKTKKAFAFIHLWIGLITGVIVFLISITGAVYVFRDELYNLIHKDVQVNSITAKQQRLPLSVLWQSAQKHLGDKYKIEDVIVYNAPNRNWEFKAGAHNDSAVTYFDWIVYDYIVYVNPYTAEVAGVVNHKLEFFQLIKMFHWSLLLKTEYGQPIVGVAVLLFVVSLISGLVIWIPKGYKQFKESLKVRWKAKWQRANNDLHRTIGFYALIPALIISITGLVWAFKWVQATVYVIAAQSITPPQRKEVKSTYLASVGFKDNAALLNGIADSTLARYPDAHSIGFYPPEGEDTAATVGAYVRPNGMVYYNMTAEKYDRFSGKLLDKKTTEDLNNGEKIIYMNYDIHVGQILGLPGKIIAFIVSLICAALPVTGFMIWWGRRKIAKQKEQRK